MKNIVKSILFATILIIILESITIMFIPKDSIKKYGFQNTVKYEILEEKQNTIDVIFLGDSLVYSSISPMEIWDQYGYTGFDCAKAAESITDTYEYLKLAIEHEHPKIVMFEANVLYRDSNKRPWYYKLKSELFSVFPITRYHDNWKQIGTKKSEIISNVNKGYVYVTRSTKYKPIHKINNPKKLRPIPKGNIEEFEKIVKICKDNNIKLVLINNPSNKSWIYSKHYATKKISEKYNLDYIDLNLIKEVNIDWANETKDDGDHLNHSGAKKVSAYIGKYLHETGLLTDKRNDNNYKSWNKANLMYKNHSSNY